MLDHPLDQHKRRPQVDGQHAVELVQRDVPHIGDAAAVPGVRNQDVRALAVILLNLREEVVELLGTAHVDLVGGDAQGDCGRGGVEGRDELVDGGSVGGEGQREVDPALGEAAGAGASDALEG